MMKTPFKNEKEMKDVLMFDLNCLKDFRNSPADFKYHYKLLKGNLQDLFKPDKNKFYPITSISKDDILQHFAEEDNYQEIKKIVSKMSDSDLKYFARKMETYYCDNNYWSDLEQVFNSYFLKRKNEK